jgi:cytoskeletal protein RodZ
MEGAAELYSCRALGQNSCSAPSAGGGSAMATVLQHHFLGAHFGELLRDARERRGLTLRDVSNETKIPQRHLEAFEHGDLTVVPNRMYRRAEVRAYARAVGLDQNVALTELENALLISGTPDPETDALETPDSIELRHPIAAMLATVAVAGILLITWQQWTRPTAQRAAEPPAPAAASPEVGPTTRASVANTPTDVGPNFNPATTAPTTAATHAAHSTPVTAPPPAPTLPVVAPATTAAAASSLIVTSHPAGARVTVDGIGWGTTPVTIRFLTAGEKTIRVIKNGYASEERSVRITDGRSTSVHVPLRTTAN